jgi:HK97 gp10 family phage protein
MPLKITLKGIDKTIKELKSTVNKVEKKELKEVANELVEKLEIATPKDTGYAASRWEVNSHTEKKLNIVNDADYIGYLNEGSSQQAPAHFIEQTVLQHEKVRPDGVIVTYY